MKKIGDIFRYINIPFTFWFTLSYDAVLPILCNCIEKQRMEVHGGHVAFLGYGDGFLLRLTSFDVKATRYYPC